MSPAERMLAAIPNPGQLTPAEILDRVASGAAREGWTLDVALGLPLGGVVNVPGRTLLASAPTVEDAIDVACGLLAHVDLVDDAL